MKKIFLIAVVLLMMINFIINYHHEVAILLNHRFDTANQGIERFAGIRFLGPKSITNLLFGELMMRIVEEELHQLVLHRSKLDGCPFS